MNNINIVPMTADHLDALEQLERTCFSRRRLLCSMA